MCAWKMQIDAIKAIPWPPKSLKSSGMQSHEMHGLAATMTSGMNGTLSRSTIPCKGVFHTMRDTSNSQRVSEQILGFGTSFPSESPPACLVRRRRIPCARTVVKWPESLERQANQGARRIRSESRETIGSRPYNTSSAVVHHVECPQTRLASPGPFIIGTSRSQRLGAGEKSYQTVGLRAASRSCPSLPSRQSPPIPKASVQAAKHQAPCNEAPTPKKCPKNSRRQFAHFSFLTAAAFPLPPPS